MSRVSIVASVLGRELGELAPTTPVVELGIDSLAVAEINCAMEEEGLDPAPEELLAGIATVGELIEWLIVLDAHPS